jgi:hypothetical protein
MKYHVSITGREIIFISRPHVLGHFSTARHPVLMENYAIKNKINSCAKSA